MDILNKIYDIIYTIVFAIYCMIFKTADEGFISLPGLKSGSLSLYQNKGEISASGGDDRYRTFEPYLRQTENSSYSQRDNHKWPIGRTLVGSTEQSLSKPPVLPCSYPIPVMGGEPLRSSNGALSRNQLSHSQVHF
jgi:hypothetical protein